MQSVIATVKNHFLEANGITDDHLLLLLGHLGGGVIEDGDIYFQFHAHESFQLEDGLVKDAGYHLDQGVGLRSIVGEKTGFAYSDDLNFSVMQEAAKAARSIAIKGGDKSYALHSPKPFLHRYYDSLNPLHSLSAAQKLDILRICDKVARLEPSVTQVMASLSGSYEMVLVAGLDGTLAADIRPLVRLNVTVIVEKEGRRETGFAGAGGRYGYTTFLEKNLPETLAKEAIRRALVNLRSVAAPAGLMPVVLGPGWPGVLLHEAVGHGLEGDFNRKGTSTFSGRVGEKVASALCTVVDDGTLLNRRGSLNMDDEGTPTQRTTLIENGILKGYLQDKLNARLMGTVSTGNGRRESYASLPLPRMTNTFMLPGFHTPEEIIASVEDGIYAVDFGGGSVDITSGKFVFSASEAYRIEKGKITTPIKGATLVGNGPEVMTKISMVGNDLALDGGIGICGKEGQSVPVGVGQPTLLIDEMTVGGTES